MHRGAHHVICIPPVTALRGGKPFDRNVGNISVKQWHSVGSIPIVGRSISSVWIPFIIGRHRCWIARPHAARSERDGRCGGDEHAEWAASRDPPTLQDSPVRSDYVRVGLLHLHASPFAVLHP